MLPTLPPRFQLNTSRLFLTYPECPVDKLTAYNYLLEKFKPEEIVVAHELHQNGNSHLHVYLKLKGALRTSDPKFADLPGGYHGNYQGCRSSKNVIQYCTKREDYVSNIDVAAICANKSSRRAHFSDLVLGKRTLDDLIKEEPQYLINYLSLSKSLKAFQEAQVVPKPLPMWLPNPWGLLLPVRTCKKRHYWLYSSIPSVGKTTFAKALVAEYGGIIESNREPYLDVDPSHRFLILDEFNSARYKYHELNAMADGTYGFRRFGSGVFRFNDGSGPIVIVLSNINCDEIYPFMNILIHARFTSIDVTKYKI